MASRTEKQNSSWRSSLDHLSWNKIKDYSTSFLFFLPAFLVLVLFRYWPLITNFRASFWEYSLLGGYGDFIALRNYTRMLDDPIFIQSLTVTLKYVLLRMPIQTVLALLLAVFLQDNTFANRIVRSAIFIPIVVSTIVVSTLWGLMYHSQIGLFNSLLSIINVPRQMILTDPNRALPAVIIAMIWKDLGFSIILLMAGLKGIPVVYREAAIIDGANRAQMFFKITLPLLKRVLMYVVVSQTIFAFSIFVPIYSMTRGGPQNATKVIVYYIYQMAFKFADMGYATALSVVVVVILLAIALFQMRLLRSDVEF